MEKRFVITYSSGATGYGWTDETNSIKDMFLCIDGFRYKSGGFEHTAFLSVWDNATAQCIFYKKALEFYPETDTRNQYASRYQRYYWKRQNELREKAIDWQYKTFCFDESETDTDFTSLYDALEYFKYWGKRFGLLEEFKENAII